MDQEYDVIVLGTGLKECIMSGLVSADQSRVLHVDRNSYYGGESASLNLTQLYERFRGGAEPPKNYGKDRDFCIDVCPKFLMASGDLVKVLLHTKVTNYLEFRSVMGSYVFKGKQIHKVPSTAKEALASGLMGMFQKRYFKSFINFMGNFEVDDKKTWGGHALDKMTSAAVFKKYKLDENTQSFTGHAICLYPDDTYKDRNCIEMLERGRLYAESVARYGNSPYIYPLYGLGGLPEGFSRRCAVAGGTYMLNLPVEEILYDAAGKVTGIKCDGKVAKCKKLISDPSYFIGTNKIKKTGQIARCICFLNHTIPGTGNEDSVQIILPAKQTGRKSDIYISVVSYYHKVAPKPLFVAVASGQVEKGGDAKQELAPALNLLGDKLETFAWTTDSYEPLNDSKQDNCFITHSFDATTHFGSVTKEVLRLYEEVQGKKLDLDAVGGELNDPQ